MKYSNGKFRMTKEGIDLEAVISPWLRACIGIAILLLAATPLVYVIRWW
ncbi:hypothetical protein [Cupriavidus gilardii]|nr:hypothetical protein [Cupriavidus gilardii]UXC37204.1 hypothetical protein N4G38_07090 [Cupriavidus gilardii]